MEVTGLNSTPPPLQRVAETSGELVRSKEISAQKTPEKRNEDAVKVEVSEEAVRKSEQSAKESRPAKKSSSSEVVVNTSRKESEEKLEKAREDAEKKIIAELKARDREVRTHEQAHKNALGPYSRGGPTYEFTTGPDGKQYAVGGQVSVDISKEADPESTIKKAQTVRRAALAPAEPSAQDRAVAAQAAQLEAQAKTELRKERAEEQGRSTDLASQASQEESTSAIPSIDEIRESSEAERSESSEEPTRSANRQSPLGELAVSGAEVGQRINVVA